MTDQTLRRLVIQIAARIGTNDNEYLFDNINPPDYSDQSPRNTYALSSLTLNYSILTSNVTSTLVMTMTNPLTNENRLQSGQYITITDNGVTVFQGVLLNCMYNVSYAGEGFATEIVFQATLAPSIYQFTLLPVIFDNTQLQQIKQLTGVNLTGTVTAGISQSIATSDFFNYMISNSDYSNYFKNSISFNDLDSSLFLMTDINTSRDQTIRMSIDYYNCIFFQQEDGQIKVQQIDYSNKSSFNVNIDNNINSNSSNQSQQTPIIPLLSYEYQDNAYLTPIAISNFAFLSPGAAVGSNAVKSVLTYSPNQQYFPRLQELVQGGWFVGAIGKTQISGNITSNPTILTSLKKISASQDVFMVRTLGSGVETQSPIAYQTLLTGKQTANALSGYANFNGIISLDDPNIPENFGNIIGTIIDLNGLSNMPTGIIAAATRNYSAGGSFLSFTAFPPGSFTGFWKNSENAPIAS